MTAAITDRALEARKAAIALGTLSWMRCGRVRFDEALFLVPASWAPGVSRPRLAAMACQLHRQWRDGVRPVPVEELEN